MPEATQGKTMPQSILVVDDSGTMRNIVKFHLMGQQLDVIEAENAERALQLLRLVTVDLVIADIDMPGMDGITFVTRLRAAATPKVRDVPVILITAQEPNELRSRGLAAGANEFLRKPLTGTGLVECVQRLLQKVK